MDEEEFEFVEMYRGVPVYLHYALGYYYIYDDETVGYYALDVDAHEAINYEVQEPRK